MKKNKYDAENFEYNKIKKIYFMQKEMLKFEDKKKNI